MATCTSAPVHCSLRWLIATGPTISVKPVPVHEGVFLVFLRAQLGGPIQCPTAQPILEPMCIPPLCDHYPPIQWVTFQFFGYAIAHRQECIASDWGYFPNTTLPCFRSARPNAKIWQYSRVGAHTLDPRPNPMLIPLDQLNPCPIWQCSRIGAHTPDQFQAFASPSLESTQSLPISAALLHEGSPSRSRPNPMLIPLDQLNHCYIQQRSRIGVPLPIRSQFSPLCVPNQPPISSNLLSRSLT